MKIVRVASYKPGLYIRRDIWFRGSHVNLYGFLFWPRPRKPRKRAGVAAETPGSTPKPTPTQYRQDSASQSSPYTVNYNLTGANNPEGKNDRTDD